MTVLQQATLYIVLLLYPILGYFDNVECDQDKFGVVPQVVPYNGSYVMMGHIFKKCANIGTST